LKKYKKLIEKERDKYMQEISQISFLLTPSNFIKEKNLLMETTEAYNCRENLDDVFIKLQKQFLYFIDRKLSKMKTRDEIIDVIYQLRYYSRLKVGKNGTILDVEEINEYFDKVLKKAITSMCKIGAIKIISMDINLNFEIIKYALDTKIIDLEQIKLSFDIDGESLIIKVYDKEVFEKQGRKKVQITSKTLEVKTKRKIKLFN